MNVKTADGAPPEFHTGENTPDNPFVHHGLLLLFTLAWGSNFVLAEVALHELSPISFSVARFVMAGATLLCILYLQARAHAKRYRCEVSLFPKVRRADWPRLILVAVLGATMAPWLGIEGLALTNGGRASLWLALCPAVSAGIGYLLQTEHISRVGVAGLAMAAGGTLGLALDGALVTPVYWLGDVLLFLAIVCTAAELHLIKPLARRYSPTSMVAARTAIGGGIYLLVASHSLVAQPWLSLGIWPWIAILVGGIVGVGLGQWIKVRALEALGPTRVVLYGNLVPPATLFIAWLALGTTPTVLEVTSGFFILLGAFSLQLADPNRPPDLLPPGGDA